MHKSVVVSWMVRAVVVCLLFVGVEVGSRIPGAAAAACKRGAYKVRGVATRTFCGSAKGTATIGTTKLVFPEGECESNGSTFAANFGTIVLGADDGAKPVKATTDYVGIAVLASAKDGVNTGLMSGNLKGKGLIVGQATVTLSGGKRKATITGTAIGSFHGAVSATVTC